jgi:hypothetical protein
MSATVWEGATFTAWASKSGHAITSSYLPAGSRIRSFVRIGWRSGIALETDILGGDATGWNPLPVGITRSTIRGCLLNNRLHDGQHPLQYRHAYTPRSHLLDKRQETVDRIVVPILVVLERCPPTPIGVDGLSKQGRFHSQSLRQTPQDERPDQSVR